MAAIKKTADQLEREKANRVYGPVAPKTPPKQQSTGEQFRTGLQIVRAMQNFMAFGQQVASAQATGMTGPSPGNVPTGQMIQPATLPNWEDAAKELYGGYFTIVESVPELRDLLRKATEQKWSDAKFQYELQ